MFGFTTSLANSAAGSLEGWVSLSSKSQPTTASQPHLFVAHCRHKRSPLPPPPRLVPRLAHPRPTVCPRGFRSTFASRSKDIGSSSPKARCFLALWRNSLGHGVIQHSQKIMPSCSHCDTAWCCTELRSAGQRDSEAA